MAATKHHEPATILDPSKVEPLVDAETIAPMLGCSAATVREWHHKLGLPAVWVGKRMKFLVSDVLAWRNDRRTVVVKREDIQPQNAAVQPRKRMTKAEARSLDEEFPY